MTPHKYLDLEPIFQISVPHPWIIAGPCSAESQDQLSATAQGIKDLPGLAAIRAGIWKPRTRPNGFEGVGSVGLEWLQQVKTDTGKQVTVEVANAQHIREALEYGIDLFWIGSRTASNPFSVQEIAEALSGQDVAVLVKNPLSPDLALWIGALERLHAAGIKRIGAIHRGFCMGENSPYRNPPHWYKAIQMKNEHPDLPLICDPSHIAGKRQFIPEIFQEALEFGFDGYMLEAHNNPQQALTDAAQQLKPEALQELFQRLGFNRLPAEDQQAARSLKELRCIIDSIDHQMLDLLSQRSVISDHIGLLKQQKQMTILQQKRWKTVLRDRLRKARSLGLDEQLITDIYQMLHHYSLKIQNRVSGNDMEDIHTSRRV